MLKTKLYKLAPTNNDYIRLFRFLGCRTISNFATVSSFHEQIEKKEEIKAVQKNDLFSFRKNYFYFPPFDNKTKLQRGRKIYSEMSSLKFIHFTSPKK